MRTVLAIVAGIAVAIGTTLLTDALFHLSGPAATPMPAADDAAGLQAWMNGVAPGSLAIVLAGWTLAAFSGAAVAARFAGRVAWPGWVVTGLYFAATAANLSVIAHPLWLTLGAVVLVPVAGWLGAAGGGTIVVSRSRNRCRVTTVDPADGRVPGRRSKGVPPMKTTILSLAAVAMALPAAAPVAAQSRSQYRDRVQDIREECREDRRDADNRRERRQVRRECRQDIRQAQRDWRQYRRYDYNRYEQGQNGYYADNYYRDGRYYQDRRLGVNDRIYRGQNGRYYCRRSDGTTGLIIGGIGGGVLGNIIAPGRSDTLGTIIGAIAGGVAGRSIDRNNVRCD